MHTRRSTSRSAPSRAVLQHPPRRPSRLHMNSAGQHTAAQATTVTMRYFNPEVITLLLWVNNVLLVVLTNHGLETPTEIGSGLTPVLPSSGQFALMQIGLDFLILSAVKLSFYWQPSWLQAIQQRYHDYYNTHYRWLVRVAFLGWIIFSYTPILSFWSTVTTVTFVRHEAGW